jgi:phospholipid/cholesterol/gamma-HCH transport system substrate-binding protein
VKDLSAELKVGIFAIVVIMVLSYMTFKVGGLPMVWEKGYRLYAEFDDISGLDEKSRIKVAGVEGGIVEKISLENGKARLILLINPDIKVYENASVILKMSGLLGDRYISLSTGSADRPVLNNGDTIVNTLPAADVGALTNQLTTAAMYITDLARSLQDIMGATEREAVRESIHNLRAVTMHLKEISGDNRESLHEIIAQLEVFSKALGDKGPGMIDDISFMARTVGEKGPELVDNLNEAARELREVLAENRYSFKESIENLQSLSESAGNVVRRIEDGEGTLGKLMTDDELYTSMTQVSKEAAKASDFVGRLRTYLDFYTEYNYGDSEWKGYFDLTLRPREDQYYIIGIVADPVGSVDETETTVDGVTVKTEEVESDIEFTLQYAKKFDDLALRIGIMESTFGFGADYFFDNEKGRVKFDMWDLGADEAGADEAHIRVGVDYKFFKLLFVTAGYDNPLNPKREGVYLGGGIKLEDEDLKYLLGSAPNISLR